MPKVNKRWLKSQFRADHTDHAVAIAIATLMDAWDRVDLSEDRVDQTLEKFVILAKGHALAGPEDDSKWVSTSLRSPAVGDTIRVPLDKYDGEKGQLLNGRIGRIVGIRHGDIIVHTEDSRPNLEDLRFRADEIEIKVS